jgi:hypothetical protein
VTSGSSVLAGWQGPSQAGEQIREQVRRDVERALREAQQAQLGAEDAARAQAEAEVGRGEAGPRVIVRPMPPGIPGTGQPIMFPTPTVPPQVVDISIAFFITVATIFIGTPLARAYARRMDRRAVAPAGGAPEVVTRLDRIEQAVEAIAVEVERISEGQRFVTKMMAEPRALSAADAGAANELRMMERGLAERAAAERGS